MTVASNSDERVDEQFEVRLVTFRETATIIVEAGRRGVEHIVPPAGEKYAFDRQLWRRRVDVFISKTGRSVRVFVDGEEVQR